MSLKSKIFFVFVILAFHVNCFSQNQVLDSLKQRLEEVRGEERIKVLIGLSYNFLRISTEESLKYSKMAFEYSKETDNERGLARALLMMGSGNSFAGDYTKAIEYQQQAFEIFQKLEDTSAMGITLNNLGINYHNLGQYSSAIEQYQNSVEIAKKLSNEIGLFYALNNIGTIYEDWNKFDLALEHYQQALRLAQGFEDRNYEGLALHNLGVAYLKLNQYRKALVYLDSSMVIRKELNDIEGIFNILINTSEVYKQINEYERAIESLENALTNARELENKTNIALAALKLGEILILEKKYQRAEPLLKEALSLSLETGEIKYLKETYKALSDYYAGMKDFGNAYENYIEYTILKDTIFNQDSRKEISEMQTLYELDKKEKEIEIQGLKIDKQKAQFYYTISGILLMIILAVLLFNRYKLKQKHYRTELEKKNIDIEQRLLRTQMNPHFIFNSLNSINSFITDNNSDSAQSFLSKFARLMRYILENSRKTFVPVEDEVNTLQLNMELEQLRFDNKFDFEIKVDETIDLEYTFIPPMLIQPFIENAIIHGLANKQSDGKILVELQKNGELMHCIVEDNGIGREKAIELKEKSSKSKRQSLGNAGYQRETGYSK